eukprot:TRINITY_DN1694_c0_g1_i1.p2 TRINITY_DN1694_c0_g1~~TRINITY_DN1694_c0_g1_i1.p2  ORF type:complete len:168 (-),score=36.32 TRINITY_DN1694_c0_g1_i1:25-528(-)
MSLGQMEGWWTYEFCYKRHLRQYHTEHIVDKAKGQQISRTTAEYFLGKYAPIDAETPAAAAAQRSQDRAGREIVGVPGSAEGTAYLDRSYRTGTVCDLTNRERETEVRYQCGHEVPDQILLVKESSTCRYTITVLSGALCKHPFFAPKPPSTSNIVCMPPGEGMKTE